MNNNIYANEVNPDHYIFIYFLFIVLQLALPFEYKKIGLTVFRVTSWMKNLILGILALITVTWTAYLMKNHVPFKPCFSLKENFWLSFIVLLLLMDFATFASHFAFHKIKILWKIHSLHHFDNFIDVFTTARFHPFEGIVFGLLLSFPHMVFIFDPLSITLVTGSAIFFSVYIHSDFRLPFKLEKKIGLIFMTSGHHLRHHDEKVDYYNSNFGLIFTLFDRLFKTYYPPEENIHYNYGYNNFSAQKTSFLDFIKISPKK